MVRKITLVCYFIALALLISGCKSRVELKEKSIPTENNIVESKTFDDNYRPTWWENLENNEYLPSYAFVDGIDQENIKVQAITDAQKKLLHYKKSYVVNLTEMILDESNSKDKFKSKSINAINSLIFNKDYARYLKRLETDFIPKSEEEYRCFVAVGLPLEAIQKQYVNQFQKNKAMASTFADSKTYLYLLKVAGLEAIVVEEIEEKKAEVVQQPLIPAVKYDEDTIPAWYKISYNNKKVMVNQYAVADSESKSIQNTKDMCEQTKMKFANDFARAEAEKYRKISGYDEIEFNNLKNNISQEVSQNNYPLSKEFVKTIQIGENSFKTYAQYSMNKKSIQNSLMKVLRDDEVLYSKLRASMAFDDLEDEDF